MIAKICYVPVVLLLITLINNGTSKTVKSIQNSRRLRRSHTAGIVSISRHGLPHSVNNFNPQSSTLVSGMPVIRPTRLTSSNVQTNVKNRPSSSISFGGASSSTVISDADRRAPITFEVPPINVSPNQHRIIVVPKIPLPVEPTSVTTPGSLPSSSSVQTLQVIFPGFADTPTPSPIESITHNISGNSIDFNNDECLINTRRAMFEGNCSILLHQGPCPEDHWLVLSEQLGTPYCANRNCPWDKVFYRGNCAKPEDTSVCRRGQILYVDITGYAECDCEPNYIYDPKTQNCYAEHERGSCPTAQYIEKIDGGKRFNCVTNPCGNEGLVQHMDGKCYIKTFRGRCPSDQLQILSDAKSADCSFIVPHTIFEAPTLTTCPDGSKRDFFHQCRSVFRVPTQVSVAESRGECPPDFFRGPRGGCRKVVSLFS